jgi:hypothetical protein|tara:strand:- start:4490 stop:5026 length:537 start_codon:yes stop_codon:yes gene_type:complete
MNKKEKFYKNLSEFNIQKPEVEKVELKDVKTLDKILRDSDKLIQTHIKQEAKYRKSFIEVENLTKEVQELDKNLDKFEKEEKDLLKKHDKERKVASDKRIKANELLQKSDTKLVKAFQKMNDDEDAAIKVQTQIKGAINNLENNIKTFQNAAKALGVDVNVDKYTSMVNKLRNKQDLV